MSFRALPLLLALLLAACGGGGGEGGGRYSISASPTSLSFSAEQASPPTAEQNVTVNYQGDGLLVGYPPGEAEPAWLNIRRTSTNNTSPQSFAISASASQASVGSNRATLRFVTGSADGENARVADVAVSFEVRASPPPPSVDRYSFSHNITEGESPPDDTAVVTHNGRPQRVESAPEWLTATIATRDASTQTLRLQYRTQALAPGNYNAEVVMRPTDGSAGSTSVQVSITVYRASLRLDKSMMTFSGVCGGSLPAAQVVRVDSTSGKATAYATRTDYSGSASNWLAPVPSGTTPQNANVRPSSASLAPGSYYAQLVFRRPDDSSGAYDPSISVNYVVAQNTPSAQPAQPGFTVDTSTTTAELTQSITLADSGAPLTWQVTATGADWLTTNRTSGDTRSNKVLTLGIDKNKLAALENGQLTASLQLRFSSTSCAGTTDLAVPVTLRLALPTIEGVMPFAAVVSAGQSHAIGGTGFDGGTSLQLKVGDQPVAVREAVSRQVLRFTAPPLQAGVYDVTISNALGITRRGGKLRYIAAATTPVQQQTIARTNIREVRRMVYDPQRNKLYALESLNTGSGALELYVYSPDVLGQWSRSKLLSLADLYDFDLSADGSKLWLAARQLYSFDLDSAGANPVEVYRRTDSFSGSSVFIDHVRSLVNGEVLLASGSGFGEALAYNPRLNSAVSLSGLNTRCPFTDTPADGSVGFINDAGCGSDRHAYSVYRPSPVPTLESSGLSGAGAFLFADRVGSRAFYVDRVYDTARHTVLASLEYGPAALFSPDGNKLYVTRTRSSDSAPVPLDTYDTSGAPAAGSYPRTSETFSGTASMGLKMAVSADGKTLFIGTFNELIITPRN